MYYATAHYDVINYTLHRRKPHFKDTVDSYKVIIYMYVTITKCDNFTYLQQIILIHVLNCSLIYEIYVKK